MNPGRTKSNDKGDAIIAALLTERTHAAVAEKAGVSEATIHRWLRQPSFCIAHHVSPGHRR